MAHHRFNPQTWLDPSRFSKAVVSEARACHALASCAGISTEDRQLRQGHRGWNLVSAHGARSLLARPFARTLAGIASLLDVSTGMIAFSRPCLWHRKEFRSHRNVPSFTLVGIRIAARTSPDCGLPIRRENASPRVISLPFVEARSWRQRWRWSRPLG